MDNTPPLLAWSAPLAHSLLRATVPLVAVASDANGVAGVDIDVDGARYAQLAAAPFATSLDTTALVDGVHTLKATSADEAGNATSTTIDVSVDNTPPALDWTAPNDGDHVHGTIPLALTSDATSIQISLDSTPYADLDTPPFATTLDTTSLADGPHELTATATDEAGNTTSTSIDVSVDSAPPALSWTAPDDGDHVHGTIPLALTSDATSIQISLDSTPYADLDTPPFATTLDTTSLADGPHS